MVDCLSGCEFAGGGDNLQGIKKGLMEVADLLVINKDDGDNHTRCRRLPAYVECPAYSAT